MIALREIKYIEGYKYELLFSDEYRSLIDFKSFLGAGMTKDLLDLKEFKKAFIEPGGGLAWPNGFDICPNFLREIAEEKNLYQEANI